jgi:isoquinoline 1-oxidoreductase beta subunit
MTRPHDPSRRDFLKTVTISASALTVAFVVPMAGCDSQGPLDDDTAGFSPNAWLRVLADNTVVIQFAEAEMGQGVITALPQILADELEADWNSVRVELAGLDPAFGNQSTGGSTSIREGWAVMREAGALGREIFLTAAAASWGVPKSECQARQGVVRHEPSGRSAAYGKLLEAAARISVPDEVPLKDPDEFRLIGTSVPRVDAREKATGKARFGVDVRLDGLLYATIVRCPVFGGRVKGYSDAATRAIDGVIAVVNLQDRLAVIGSSQWWALEGARALDVEWDTAGNETLDSETIYGQYRAAAAEGGTLTSSRGHFAAASTTGAATVDAEYLTPFQAHATMEPMACTAHVADGRCEVWAPTQDLSWAHSTAAHQAFREPLRFLHKVRRRLGLGDPVKIHRTLIGGGFGRRLEQDFVADAVEVAREMGAPVQVMWSRGEDMQHDFYHPASLHRMTGVLDGKGLPVAWRHRLAGDGVSAPRANRLRYAIPNVEVYRASVDTPVPTGPWRGVGEVYNAYAAECFMDELAVAGGWDPLEMRLRLLEGAPRLRHVTQVAAERSGWGQALPEGHGRGIAVHEAFGSATAQVAEVRVEDGRVQVLRVTCVVDCGVAIHPDTVAAQMEGAIAFGLTAALKSHVTIRGGRVEQSNFHDFPILTMAEMPQVSVHIIPSRESPGGIGEAGVPPIAPAVANAVFAATGQRSRRLPLGTL